MKFNLIDSLGTVGKAFVPPRILEKIFSFPILEKSVAPHLHLKF